MYKYSNSTFPGMFENYFNKMEDTRSYNTLTVSVYHLYMEFRNTKRGSLAPAVVQSVGVKFWTSMIQIVLLDYLRNIFF